MFCVSLPSKQTNSNTIVFPRQDVLLIFHKLFLFYLFISHIYISVYAAELLLRRCASELPDCCCCAAALTGCCILEMLQFSFKIEICFNFTLKSACFLPLNYLMLKQKLTMYYYHPA